GQTTRSASAKTLLVTVISDDKKDAVVEAIVSAARTGEIGDGKIFVSEISDTIRVRTGESGSSAI
ncbi:MAG: P-II family nitrogen regulator, partial [Chloroflexota bacterium]|nr:P-II family nitrogen regulator [Chloroflexota bacterium]